MNLIRNFAGKITSAEAHDTIHNVAGLTTLASVCAYGGTFFFSSLTPLDGVLYLGSVSLISHVAYLIFGNMKDSVESPKLKQMILAVQLLQIPMVFYFFPGTLASHMTAASKLEIIITTAHFVAIPAVFYLGIEAWKAPSFTSIAAATGSMLTLTSGLRNFIRV